MYRIPRYRVQLVREGTQPASVKTISSPADAFAVLHDWMVTQDRETFIVLMLDTRNQIIGLNIVSIGTVNASLVHPRECFKPCLLANCAAVILAHNHPSGDPTPSQEDLALTGRLKQAGELLGIPVVDHLIIGEYQFVSLKERGLL
ncbi:MAG: RadC family protein [Armatimonadota bacterium]